MLSDFLDAINPARLGVTMLAGLVFGFFALGAVMANPRTARALGDVQYGKQVAKVVFVVAMVFTVPQILLSLVGLDGPTGRAISGPFIWGLFCFALDGGVRLRVRWVTRKRFRRRGTTGALT